MNFDTDLKIKNGDLGFTNSGDLDITSGKESLWQSVTLSLSTVLGTYLFNSKYGSKLGQYVDEPLTDELRTRIKTEVLATLSLDKRIKQVECLDIIQDKGILLYLKIIDSNGEKSLGHVRAGG